MARLKLGLLANEFFDLDLGSGRMGGFGWARQVARCFADPERGIDLVYVAGLPVAPDGAREMLVHGTRLIQQPEHGHMRDGRRLRAERLDALLLIDYRPTYRAVCSRRRWIGYHRLLVLRSLLPRLPWLPDARRDRALEGVRRVVEAAVLRSRAVTRRQRAPA